MLLNLQFHNTIELKHSLNLKSIDFPLNLQNSLLEKIKEDFSFFEECVCVMVKNCIETYMYLNIESI